MRIVQLLPTIASEGRCKATSLVTCAERYNSIAPGWLVSVIKYLSRDNYRDTYETSRSSRSCFLSFPYQSSNWKTRASLDWYPELEALSGRSLELVIS